MRARPNLAAMRKLARIGGLIWMAVIAVIGIFFLGDVMTLPHGPTGSIRGEIFLIFAAMLPGALAYRWGTGRMDRNTPVHSLGGRTRINRMAETGHELRLDRQPEKPS